jgi:hypothetical protein
VGGGLSSSRYGVQVDRITVSTQSPADPLTRSPADHVEPIVSPTQSGNDGLPGRQTTADRSSDDHKHTVNTEENKHKTRGSNSEFSWSKLTAEIMLAVVKAGSPAEFLAWDAEGVQAFGWGDSEVARHNRLCLWVSSLRYAKANGGNAGALLVSAIKGNRQMVIPDRDEDTARNFLAPPLMMDQKTVRPLNAADHETGDASKLDQVKALAVLAVRRPPLVPTPPIRRTQSDVAKSARTAGATLTA